MRVSLTALGPLRSDNRRRRGDLFTRRNKFSIFMICSCSILTAVSGLVCLTSIAVSSANVNTVLFVVVGMFAVYIVYSIGPRTLPCGIPALMSLT